MSTPDRRSGFRDNARITGAIQQGVDDGILYSDKGTHHRAPRQQKSKNGPVITVDQRVWRKALKLAHDDTSRLSVQKDGSIIIRN